MAPDVSRKARVQARNIASVSDYRRISLWMDQVDDDLTPRPPLEERLEVDVAIVGAGYTGLWTAYYLKKADPSIDVAIVEKEIAGFGASGRNGGWCSALFAASDDKITRLHGSEAAVEMQSEMQRTVDEVGRVAAAEHIDCDFHKGGTLTLATAEAHLERVRALAASPLGDHSWLSAEETRSRIDTEGCIGAAFTEHCARLQPASLARGLARAVEGLGVRLFEGSPVTDIQGRTALTQRGSLTGGVVVRATEGYTPNLPGMKRALMPVYSLMIATEPLPQSFWDEVGWQGRETITDGRHLLIYAQRTADDRIAFGGRGAPYHFGSKIAPAHENEPAVFRELEQVLKALWPAASSATITHRWGGPLGVPRDWYSSVGLDRKTGRAWAGGYVGDGVSTSNLAGRTLADLIEGRDTAIARLPWVGHRSKAWEPEPLRWLGTNLSLKVMAGADKAEARTGRPARRAKLVGRLIGS
jgi:glycine/D-amino acid oxidase-like deaminating enzyme